MIQRLLLVLGVVNLAVTIYLLAVFYNSRDEVAYVDSSKLVSGYKGMANARLNYQDRAKIWNANLDTLAKEIQLHVSKYEDKKQSMSLKERETSEKFIDYKRKQFTEYRATLSTQAKEADDKMTADVLKQVNAYLKRYGASRGYKIILAATSYGNLAYADEVLDVTDDVLNGLNAEYTGK